MESKSEFEVQMPKVPSFSLSDFNASDTADLEIMISGRPTGWFWTFAGPGHPQAVAYSEARARERLHEERLREQAIANGKKWKPSVETVDDVKMRNVNTVVARLVDWSPIEMNGEIYKFTPDNARDFLKEPARGSVLAQALEFIFDDTSFTKRLPAA